VKTSIRRVPGFVSGCEAGCHQDSPPFEIDLSDAGLDHRQRETRVQLKDVVGDAGGDLRDRAQCAAALLLHRQADELEGVVSAGLRLGEVCAPHLERCAALDRAIQPDDNTASCSLALDDLDRLAADDELGARRETLRLLAGVLDHEGAVQTVRLSYAPYGD
jgi:hypothetical protein